MLLSYAPSIPAEKVATIMTKNTIQFIEWLPIVDSNVDTTRTLMNLEPHLRTHFMLSICAPIISATSATATRRCTTPS